MTWSDWGNRISGFINRLLKEARDDDKRIKELEKNSVTRKEFMSAIDDITAAEANVKAAVLAKVTDLQAQLAAALAANVQPDLTAPLESLAADMNAFADSLKPVAP